MPYEVIPSSLAIKAMRDSGYKDTAHAIAELVDNSIQAGSLNRASEVEIICIDKIGVKRKVIDRIAVYDNGIGMKKETLRSALQFGNGTRLSPDKQTGIGKFGMGLPNSSISQCRRVDVWSWQNNKVLHTYLDIDEIQSGNQTVVPEPSESEIPSEFVKLVKSGIKDSGTLILWSKLDRVKWKTSKALFQHSELSIGRMYRHFINSKEASIRLTTALQDANNNVSRVNDDRLVKPNDPLQLMKDTSCPLFNGDVLFDDYGTETIDVALPNGTQSTVTIKFSIIKNGIRRLIAEKENKENPGDTTWGKHFAKNVGVSVVRTDRELELNQSFVSTHDPRERWWGAEVSFSPALDDIFGVTNNKQAATAFYAMNLGEDAEKEGMTSGEYTELLSDQQDPRLLMYRISNCIESNLGSMRGIIKNERQKTREKRADTDDDPAERKSTRATTKRIEEGHIGSSDQDDTLPPEEKIQAFSHELEEKGIPHKEATDIAIAHVKRNIKYSIIKGSYDGPSFFSISSTAGKIIVTINQEHPVATHLYELLEDNESTGEALEALKIMLNAWARMEDEAQTPILKNKIMDMRNEWGRMVRDFLLISDE